MFTGSKFIHIKWISSEVRWDLVIQDDFAQSFINWWCIKFKLHIFAIIEPPPSGGEGPMKLPLSVGQRVCKSVGHLSFFSEMAHKIFVKFYFEGLKGQKLTEPNFSEKVWFWRESPKVPPEKGFLGFAKNLIHGCLFFIL